MSCKKYFIEQKALFVFILMDIIASAIVSGVSPYFLGKTVDAITLLSRFAFIRMLSIYMVLLCLNIGFTYIESILGQLIVNKIENSYKQDIISKILSIPAKQYYKLDVGELFTRVDFDVSTIVNYYVDVINSSLMLVINLIVSVYFMIHISVKLSLIAVLFIPFLYTTNYLAREQIKETEDEVKKSNEKFYGLMTSILSQLKQIRIFSIENFILVHTKEALERRSDSEIKNVKLSEKIVLIQGIINCILTIAILGMAGYFIMKKVLTIGAMVAFNSYMEKLIFTVGRLLQINRNKQGVYVSKCRLEEIYFKDSENKSSRIDMKSIESIEFSHVCFSYNDSPVLTDINLNISKHGLYGLVGENGSGKTTLFGLIDNIYDCDDGKILINSIPIDQFVSEDIRNSITYVSREPLILPGDIWFNLRLRNYDISNENIINACKKVDLHQDIMEFESQYYTLLEAGGCNMSGGQLQKLSFARALLNPASVYLFDEVTSNIDIQSEYNICGIIKELSKDAIVFLISHREQPLEICDKVFFLKDGEIKTSGKHVRLLEQVEEYRRFFNDNSD